MHAGKIKVVLWLGLAFLAPTASQAQSIQEWAARYDGFGGGDQANDMAVDADGNVYVAGYSTNLLQDYLTIKYDPNGQIVWMASYNGSGNGDDQAVDLALDGAGNILVTGFSQGAGTNYDIVTIKYSPSGEQLWVARYSGASSGDDEARVMAVDLSGNVYVAGYIENSSSGFDYATIKYDASGNQQWVAVYDGPASGSDQINGVGVDDSGNVYVSGASVGIGTSFDFATIKYSPEGVQQWAARYDGPISSGDGASSLVVNSAGDVWVAGNGSGVGTWKDMVTIKYNTAGMQQWLGRYNGPANLSDKAYGLAIDEIGNAYVTGESDGVGSDKDFATVKYSSDGQQLWVARYNGADNLYDLARAVTVDGLLDVYTTGYSVTTAMGTNLVTIKYDSLGQQQWVEIYNGPGNGDEEPQALSVDAAGRVYVAGGSTGISTLLDYITIKYNPPGMVLTPLSPPIVIPPSGGSFDFNLTASNNLTTPSTFGIWVIVQLPDQSWYGPVLGPVNVTLPGSGTVSRLRTQSVPAGAPAGNYLYEGRAGAYPSTIWDSDNFSFTKLASGSQGSSAEAWTNQGEKFAVETGGTKELAIQPENLSVSIQPNPFNPTTTIRFELPEAGWVKVEVFDVKGRSVWAHSRAPLQMAAGTHEITFDGSALPSGIYFVRLTTGEYEAVQKMVLMK